MHITSIPLIDTGQNFDFDLHGYQLRGRRYTPGNLIDLDQFLSFDAQTNCLEYYFQNFLSPVDTIDLREIIIPLSPTLWDQDTLSFGVVKADL